MCMKHGSYQSFLIIFVEKSLILLNSGGEEGKINSLLVMNIRDTWTIQNERLHKVISVDRDFIAIIKIK